MPKARLSLAVGMSCLALALACGRGDVRSEPLSEGPATLSPAWASVARSLDIAAGGKAVDPRPSTARLASELRSIEARSDGAVELSRIGDSNEKRPIWSARVGYGPIRILYVTQQHGNEPLGTPAALEFLRKTGIGDDPWQTWLRKRVTVDIVVRANADGFERNWRYNYDPDADPEYGERGKGYDINRYHNPGLSPEENPASEAAHIQRHYAAFDPAIVVDYHMQGRYFDPSGREITASVMWPTHPDTKPEDRVFAKQISVIVQQSMTAAGGNVSQYPGGDYEGIARNAYGLRGAGSVLVELSAMGSAREQEQIRSALASMIAIADTAAKGEIDEIDPARADQIPPRGSVFLRVYDADSDD